MSVPVGRCGPCCSTLPAGRMTSGFLLELRGDLGLREIDEVAARQHCGFRSASVLRAPSAMTSASVTELAVALDRAQRGVDARRPRRCRCRAVSSLGFAGAAALGEHLELVAEHVAFRDLQLLALAVAVLAALDVERRGLVHLVRRVPRAEVDLVVHQAFRAEDADGEDAGRGPARADVADLAVGEAHQRHRLVVDLGADRRELRGHRGALRDLAAEIVQRRRTGGSRAATAGRRAPCPCTSATSAA